MIEKSFLSKPTNYTIAFLALFLTMAISGSSQISKSKEDVTIYLGWFHQFQFAGYYAAVEKGFYKQEGLNVKLAIYDRSTGVDSVHFGKYEYGIATAGQIISSEYKDNITVVAPIFQQSPLTLITKKDSDINTLKDLEGKRVAVGNELQAMMHVAGVDLNKVEIRSPTSYKSRLLSDEVSAITHYIIDSLNTDQYKLFRPIEYGVHFYGECLYTTRKEREENPDRLESMHRATIKGWEYAINNREELIDIIIEKYNPGIARKILEHEAEVVVNSQILPAFYPVGYNDMDRWIHMEKTLSSFLDIKSSVSWDSFIYAPASVDQKALLNQVIRVAWISGSISILVFLGLFIYNVQLKKAVKTRTATIETAKEEIETINQQLIEQKEELEALSNFKSKMLSIISHDVRGPLNAVQGLIDLTASQSISREEFREYVQHSKAKIHDINAFMDNLLYWAKNQSHGIQIDKKNVSLRKLIHKTVTLLSTSAESKGIALKDNSEELDVFIDVDTIRLVVRNIISNAIKFCDKGDEVMIETEASDRSVKITITDTGPGIEVDLLPKIFDSGHPSTPGTKDEIGIGLGLQLCKEFVELNSGEIGVSSIPGEGSQFWFSVPRS